MSDADRTREASASKLVQVEKGLTFEVWRASPTSVLRLDWTRQGACRLMMVGQGDGALVGPILRRCDMVVRTSRITILNDFWAMAGYESPFRVELTNWVTTHRANVDGVHMLVQSKLVAMGAAVANLAVGGFYNITASRAEFDRTCQKLGLPVNPPVPK